jgi:uncharacterized membrane protein/protein-disulfide isomerase
MTASEIAGCAGDSLFDCNHVLMSQWGKSFGLPVSLLALMMHGGALIALLAAFVARRPAMTQWTWRVVTLVAFSAGLAAVWFIGLQFFVVGRLCSYCLIAHGSGLALAVLALATRAVDRRWKLAMASIAACGLGLLVGGHFAFVPPSYKIENHAVPAQGSPTELFSPPSETEDAPSGATESSSMPQPQTTAVAPTHDSQLADWTKQNAIHRSAIALLDAPVQLLVVAAGGAVARPSAQEKEEEKPNSSDDEKSTKRMATFATTNPRGSTSLDTRQWPLVGDPDAKHVCVELFDYTCPHCRNTQRAILAVFDQYGEDFALVALPVPLNTQCNSAVQSTGPAHAEACKIAELAIAVWRLAPDKFRGFHEWVLSGATVPSTAEIRQRAEQLVGKDQLQAELAKPQVGQYIAKHVELYRRVGGGIVPKILFPNTSIVGEISSGQPIVDILERSSAASK